MSDQNKQSDEERGEEVYEILKRHGVRLREHFDTVQIFVTKHREDGGTEGADYGDGNAYARRDQVREWVMREDQDSLENRPR